MSYSGLAACARLMQRDDGRKKFPVRSASSRVVPSHSHHSGTHSRLHSMKEIKRTPVPLPAPRTKLQPKEAPARSQLSQEIINSEDEEDMSEESAATPTAKTSARLKATLAIHTPNGIVHRPKEKLKEPSAGDKRTSPTGSKKSQSITDDNETDSSSADDSDDQSDEQTMSQAEKTHVPRIVDSQIPPPTTSRATESQSSQSYVPPKGFKCVTIDDRTVSRVARMFEDLDGKQIWHLTAPAGVSIKELRQLAMDKVLKNQALLTYKGIDYGFSQAEESGNLAQQVLVPGKTVYKAVPASISQTLHLQAVVRLPELGNQVTEEDADTSSTAIPSITRSTIRNPRAQVRGLKMRFLPIGFEGEGAGTIGSSDDEAKVPTKIARLPKSVGVSIPSRHKEKRKHADFTGPESAEAPVKRSKKQHRSAEDLKRKGERRAKKEKRREHEASSAKA